MSKSQIRSNEDQLTLVTYLTDMTNLTFLIKNIFNFKLFKICLVQKMQWPPKPAAKKY